MPTPEVIRDDTAAVARPVRWGATSRAGRRLLGAAAVLAALAVLLGVNAVRAHRDVRVRTVAPTGDPALVTVDAAGCPAAVKCVVERVNGSALAAAFGRAFPTGHVESVQQTARAEALDRPYRVSLIARVDTGAVRATAQCVPGSAPVTANVTSIADSRRDFSGNTIIYARHVAIRTPGASGCSVYVQVDTEAHGDDLAPEAAARRLAGDPTVQLRVP